LSVTNTTPGGEASQNQVKNLIDLQANQPSAFTGSTGSGLGFKGYKIAYNESKFYGYRQGPGYWGKTFYIWPPDPTVDSTVNPNSHTGYSCDWRKRFFLKSGGSYPNFGGPVNDNTLLWTSGSGSNGGGLWRNPVNTDGSVNYVINYQAILQWIQNSPEEMVKEVPPWRRELRRRSVRSPLTQLDLANSREDLPKAGPLGGGTR
jgi:hypothetical protein